MTSSFSISWSPSPATTGSCACCLRCGSKSKTTFARTSKSFPSVQLDARLLDRLDDRDRALVAFRHRGTHFLGRAADHRIALRIELRADVGTPDGLDGSGVEPIDDRPRRPRGR